MSSPVARDRPSEAAQAGRSAQASDAAAAGFAGLDDIADRMRALDFEKILDQAGVSEEEAVATAKAFEEQRYGEVFRTWQSIEPARKREAMRQMPREVRMTVASIDDLGLRPEDVDTLVGVTSGGNVEAALDIYDRVPVSARARIISRLPKKMRVVGEAFDGMRRSDKLGLAVDLLPAEAYNSRVERMGATKAAAGGHRQPGSGPQDVSDRLGTIGATGAIRSQVATLASWVRDGPFSLRVLSFLAGLFAIGAAAVGFFVNLGDLGVTDGRSLLFLVINVWIGIFGLLLAVSEAKLAICSSYLRKIVEEWLPLLRSTSGRAWFMFFVGSLALSQWTPTGSQILNLASGIALEVLAVANWVVSCRATASLRRIRESLAGPEVEAKFDEFDIDGSGKLDSAEFAELCSALGTSLSREELESALLTMDTNRDGVISRSEFLAWWRGDGTGGGWMKSVAAMVQDDNDDGSAAPVRPAAGAEAYGTSARHGKDLAAPLLDSQV